MSYRNTKCPLTIATEPAACEGPECQWFIATRGRCAIAVLGEVIADDAEPLQEPEHDAQ